MIQVVDLSKYINLEDRYLSGRDEGNDFKKMLDKKVKFSKAEKLEIEIPPTLVGINMSFFLGLFEEIMGKFKTREEIKENIKFDVPNTKFKKYIEKDIRDGIKEILEDKLFEKVTNEQ